MSAPLVSATAVSLYINGGHLPQCKQACCDSTGRYVFVVDNHPTPYVEKVDLQTSTTTWNWAALPVGNDYSACYLSTDGLYVVVCTLRGRRFRVAIADPSSIDEIDPLKDASNFPLQSDMFMIHRQSATGSVAYGAPMKGAASQFWSIDLDTGLFEVQPYILSYHLQGRVKNHYHYAPVTSVYPAGYWHHLARSGVANFNAGRRDFLAMNSDHLVGKLSPLASPGDSVTGEDAHRVAEPQVNCAGCDDGATAADDPENIYSNANGRIYRYNIASDTLTLLAGSGAVGESMLWIPQRNAMFCTGSNSGTLLTT